MHQVLIALSRVLSHKASEQLIRGCSGTQVAEGGFLRGYFCAVVLHLWGLLNAGITPPPAAGHRRSDRVEKGKTCSA
jgi:hypothetical protein